MRKLSLIVLFTAILATWNFSSDFSVNFNINYNYGVSDFFEESRHFLSYDGKTFVEQKHNYLGFGFNLSVTIPVIERLYVVPGFSMRFGHQNYEYSEIPDDPEIESEKNTFFFHIVSGELNLVYDLLTFKKEWTIQIMAGLTYNQFSADEEMRSEDKTYWGFHPGIGVKFLQMKHFGFQLNVYYDIPFNSELFSYINTYIGIMYRF
jgi:opacity protein-like surface antigen